MSEIPTDREPDPTRTSVESARVTAVNDLTQRVSRGNVTLEEYAERTAALEQATSADEITAALQGLPEGPVASSARASHWLVSVLGGTEKRGRWRLGKRLRIVAVLGGAKVDLGAAQLEAPEPVITAVALFGGVDILAPSAVPIEFSGVALLGGKSDKRAAAPTLPGSPVIHVRVFAVFGGVGIKDPKVRRGLLAHIGTRWGPPPGTSDQSSVKQ